MGHLIQPSRGLHTASKWKLKIPSESLLSCPTLRAPAVRQFLSHATSLLDHNPFNAVTWQPFLESASARGTMQLTIPLPKCSGARPQEGEAIRDAVMLTLFGGHIADINLFSPANRDLWRNGRIALPACPAITNVRRIAALVDSVATQRAMQRNQRNRKARNLLLVLRAGTMCPYVIAPLISAPMSFVNACKKLARYTGGYLLHTRHDIMPCCQTHTKPSPALLPPKPQMQMNHAGVVRAPRPGSG
jgi:hypothetical protein